ncbi:hypothetical protein MTO96_007729 [Rhipicephalus appendiculatus]
MVPPRASLPKAGVSAVDATFGALAFVETEESTWRGVFGVHRQKLLDAVRLSSRGLVKSHQRFSARPRQLCGSRGTRVHWTGSGLVPEETVSNDFPCSCQGAAANGGRSSFWVHGAVFGIINCFGVLYPVIHDLAPDKEQASFHASLVGSLCVGSTFAMSPVASLLADKFGARITVICGGLIGSLGLLLSSWAFKASI